MLLYVKTLTHRQRGNGVGSGMHKTATLWFRTRRKRPLILATIKVATFAFPANLYVSKQFSGEG